MSCGLWYKYVVGGVVLVLLYVICSHKCFCLLYDTSYAFLCGCKSEMHQFLGRIRHFSVEHVRGSHRESCDMFCSINTCGLWYNYAAVYSINAFWLSV